MMMKPFEPIALRRMVVDYISGPPMLSGKRALAR